MDCRGYGNDMAVKSIQRWAAVHRPSSLAWRSFIGVICIPLAADEIISEGQWFEASLFLAMSLYFLMIPGIKDKISPVREWCRRLRSLKDRWEEQS
jgi:hypothetical protein